MKKRRVRLSGLFFAAGILCIAVPGIHELVSVPWASINDEHVNEVVMREPAPLPIGYVDYEDMPVSTPRAAALTPAELPGGEDESGAGLVSGSGEAAAWEEPAAAPEPTQEPAYVPAVMPDGVPDYVRLGAFKIPRLDVSENLLEGAGVRVFDYGIGHVQGTALPGEEGNSVVAAHRVSNVGMEPFRYLDQVQAGDVITIDFNGGTYQYEAFESFIVSKYDTWVMSPVEDETHVLTLVTCDPVIHPGNRPDRLILRARLAETGAAGAAAGVE